MRLVKPLRLGLLKRSILWGGRTLLSFGLITAFPLAAPRRIMKEGDMWEAITPALGDQVLDSGEPKRRGEVVVHGHYFAPGGKPVLQHGVRVAVGPVDKSIRVTGPREWATDAHGQVVATAPQPIDSVPIDWKYAFGGPAFPENPGGRGYWPEDTRAADARYPLPLLEYPGDLMARPDDIVAPAGLGPRDIMLPSRQRFAGTYDRYWADNHAPGLARDATPDLFQVASADQQFPAFIGGGEHFTVENMHPELAMQSGQLPGVRARAFVRRTDTQQLQELSLATDTCVLFPALALGLLIHRGCIWVSAFDHPELDLFLGAFEWQEHAPRPPAYYQEDLIRRRDPEQAARLALDYLSLSPEGWVEPPADKAAWFKVMKPRSFTIPPSLQARMDEAQAELAMLVPADKMAALAHKPVPGPEDEGPTAAALRAEVAAFDTAAGLKNPASVKPQLERIKALARQAADERVGEAEDKVRQFMARRGADYDAIKQAAAAKPRPTPLQMMAQTDAFIDEAAATAPPEVKEKLLAAKLGPHAGLAAQAMSDLATLAATSKAAIGHVMPAPPPVPPAEAARRTAAAQALLAQDGASLTRGEFAGLDLSGVSFANRDLTEADFAGCILAGADFSGSDLTHANFAGADLEDARFTGAKLLETNLGKTRLDRTDFCKARLIKVTLSEAIGTDTVFDGAELLNVAALKPRLASPSFIGATLKEVNFLDAEMDDAKFDGAKLEKLALLNTRADRACFQGAVMTRPTVIKSQLRGADFSGAAIDRLSTVGGVDFSLSRFDRARLPAASFIAATLAGTQWTSANAAGALFNNADLQQAVFTACLLRGALFMRAVMTEMRMDGSDCADASFIRADMRRASLRNVSLYGADLTDALLDDAVIDGGMIDNTILAGRNFPS